MTEEELILMERQIERRDKAKCQYCGKKYKAGEFVLYHTCMKCFVGEVESRKLNAPVMGEDLYL